jgi:hypothetical protein
MKTILILILAYCFLPGLEAQNNPVSMQGRNIYKPGNSQVEPSTTTNDSIDARQQFINDSVAARLVYVQDSILAREKFVRDSIQRRKEIVDSLNFLKTELPVLLDASLKTFTDQIIVINSKVQIVGDSTLSNYSWVWLPLSLDQPFVPWKSKFNLSDKPIKLSFDTINKKITSIETSLFNSFFVYNPKNKILRINEPNNVISNKYGKFYKVTFDSVFFDTRGRVINIKRYIQLYQTVNYQKGALILSYMFQAKQFEYGATDQYTKYKIVNFCDRWTVQDPNKVCSIINYGIANQGKSIIMNRNNDPANVYSDGTFNFEFEGDYILKSVSFNNQTKSEDWKIFVELNEIGNASRYVYQTKGVVHRTLLVNYFLDDPKAKNKVETITCTFEDDGISYYQINNTTGKSRTRDKFTGEWGPWK